MNLKRTLALTCALVLLASPAAYAAAPGEEAAVSATKIMAPDKVPTTVAEPVKAPDAKPAISEEDALKIALTTFGVPESYGKPTVNFWQDQQSGNATWTFYWNPETHPNLAAKFYLNIGINANDGSIISYSWSDQFANEPKEAKFDRASALPKAEEWLKKLVSAERLTSLKRDDPALVPGDQLNFAWVRLVNDIPFYNNMVSISIDPVTGDLQNFNINWEEVEFPAKTTVISLAQAQDAWNQKVGVELLYQDLYNRITGSLPHLVYRLKQEGLMIDAATGKVIDWSGNDWAGDYKPVAIPAPAKVPAAPTAPLTQEQALALVREAIGGMTLNAPASASSSQRNTSKFASEDMILVWNFTWNSAENQSYSSVGVDATHGVIIDIYSGKEWKPDGYYKDQTPIAETDARQRAIDAFVKIRPDLVGQVQLLDTPVTEKYAPPEYIQRQYNFQFVRLANGILYPNNQVSVSIDRFSGETCNVNSNWSHIELPKTTELIMSQDAIAVMSEEAPLELVYTSIYPNKPMAKEPVKPTIQLVYRAKATYGGSAMIDARTGHLLDFDGRDLTEMRRGVTDIAGHEAEAEIKLAINRGIFATVDGKFSPLGTVSRGELAKALVTAFDRPIMFDYMKVTQSTGAMPPAPSYSDVSLDDPYAPYIDAAMQLGIFKPVGPDSKFEPAVLASREEVALYVVRAMGFAFIDSFDAVISSGYSDQETISAANRNAVGLLVGLKVLTKGGEFKPQAEITRADLAKILIKATQVKMPFGPYPYFRG